MDDMLSQVEPLIPALRRYARGLVGDPETADDIVQDCLEKVVAHWHRRRKDDARSWIFAILHNLAINKLRHGRRYATVAIETMPEENEAHQATQEETVYGKEVVAAVEKLTPDHRALLLLVSVEDLSYSEAAKILDIPVGTVMSRLSRAREQLRLQLERRTVPGGARIPFIRRIK